MNRCRIFVPIPNHERCPKHLSLEEGFLANYLAGLPLPCEGERTNKMSEENKWDNMVGGGLSVGHSILETAHKEAMEEASIPSTLMRNLASAGTVSFYFESERGLFPNTEFVFDLELPLDFVPQNADGEVQGFELLPAAKCLEKLFTPDFKTTSAPVVLDFFVRHGIISPGNEPHYTRIVELLHVPLQTIYNHRFLKENGQVVPNINI